jgi:hypothetical protein
MSLSVNTWQLTMPPTLKHCQFCQKGFTTQRAVNQHISASTTCLKEWHKNIVRENDSPSPKRRRVNSPDPCLLPNPDIPHNFDDADNCANLEDTDNKSDDVDPVTHRRYVEPFPGPAGETLRCEKTRFEILEGEQRTEGKAPWEPFASRAEWELAEWLVKNVRQRSTDKYLQLPIVS